MKRMIFYLLITVAGIGTSLKANAQEDEVAQLLLNVEKLAQLEQILSDMKKGYQVVGTGYNAVRDVAKGNFSLHHTFIDGLMQVNPAVKDYRKVAGIIDHQIQLVKEYKSSFKRFKESNSFNMEELDYLTGVYNELFKQSLNSLDDLAAVITANRLRMSDDERLEVIDNIFIKMQDKLQFLRYFNNRTTMLSLQRAKDKNDVKALRKIYGLTK